MVLTFLVLTATAGHTRSNSDTNKALYDSVDQMRALEVLSSRQDTRRIFAGDPSTNANLQMLSALPVFEDNSVLPYKDSSQVAKRIDALLQTLEKGENNEAAQVTRFNIAYEYFLFYLSFLNESYLLRFAKDEYDLREVNINQLITEDELSMYLMQAQMYLQGLTSGEALKSKGKDESKNAGRIGRGSANFNVRNDRGLSMNTDFLAFMIECEKLAGRFRMTATDAAPSESLVMHYDQSAWNWLNELWKRYRFQADACARGKKDALYVSGTTYCPDTETLFSLYKIYLSYNFMWRYLIGNQDNAPFLNSTTRVMLQRLSSLSKELKQAVPFNVGYLYYEIESSKDAGQTDFMPGLFFARRGYFMAHLIKKEMLPRDLFALYESFFSEAAERIRSNISYRGRLYNELILFGLALNDLQLMETTLYDYALKSMRLEPQADYKGEELARSSRLTTAYLIANILDAKDKSGLYEGCDRYREMGDDFSPLLLSSSTENWQYALTMHLALAHYYSQGEYFNESLGMYHARQAFLVPCEKVALTYGGNWQYFFKMPGRIQAVNSLKEFLYFHNKYSTNPEAAVPQKFNAPRIVSAWIAAEKK